VSKLQIGWQRTLAELVTIVAGVMIALMANDWRDAVRDRAEAKGYAARLDQAVSSDLEEYARAAEWATAVDSAAVEVLAVYRGRDVRAEDADRFFEAVLTASWMPPPAVSRDTYDDLVSTGSLALLPVAVREQVGAYYRQAQVYADREESFKDRLAGGYWGVPPSVLGPEVLPGLWRALAAPSPRDRPEPAGLSLTPRQLGEVVARLRRIPDLEAQIAEVRHVMVQREVIYGDRLTEAARQLRRALVSGQ
jgi:hypothetical protein